MQDLAVGAHQRQLAIGHLVLHVARFLAAQQPGTRATGPQGLLAGAGGQHGVHRFMVLQPLKRADGREDDEELPGLVALQRVGRTHPHRLELFGFIGHGLLAFGHAGDEEGHIKAARQVAVGDPVGHHVHAVGSQRQPECLALRGEGRLAVQRGDVPGAGVASVGMARQQHAQLLEALADGGNRLCEVQVALAGPARRVRMRRRIGSVNSAAGKHIGARREAGGHGAARHQHLHALGAVAQQKHGRGGSCRGGFALRMQQLGGSDHAFFRFQAAAQLSLGQPGVNVQLRGGKISNFNHVRHTKRRSFAKLCLYCSTPQKIWQKALTGLDRCSIIQMVDSTSNLKRRPNMQAEQNKDPTERQMTKIAREAAKFTVQMMKADGIGTAEFDFIHLVRHNPGMTQADVRAALKIDKGAAARRAASLEAKGYLVRKPNPDDGRSQLLYATPKAEELKNSKAAIETVFYAWLVEELPEAEREAFCKTLETLYWRSKNQRRAGFPDVTARVQQMNGEELQDEEHGKRPGAPAGPGAELLRKPEAGAGGGNGIGPDL